MRSFSGTDALLHHHQTRTRAVTCGKCQSESQAHVHGVKIQKGSMVSILRPRTIFAQRAPMIADTNFQLSEAYEAHERAMSWETSPNAWRANVLYIEIYHGLRRVPGLRDDQLNELLELRAEKKMSFITPSVELQIEGLSDNEMFELIAFRKEKKLCVPSVSSTNILTSHRPFI